MSGIYLGNAGLIRLQRIAASSFSSVVDTAAVNTSANRLELDFPVNTFTTGDRIAITRVGGGALDFISGNSNNSINVYVNVDGIGGLKLYTNWADALNNIDSNYTLVAPGTTYTATFELLGDGVRTFGQVSSYTLSTNRASADVTSLGDAFQKSTSTLISGSGTMECFWDYATDGAEIETAMYFHQLVLRQQLGSAFKAALVIKQAGYGAAQEVLAADSQALYYMITGLITNVAMSFEPSEPIRTTIEFVTTGLIALRYGVLASSLLLQEDGDELLLEQGAGSLLLEDP
jgi:hypothetical protein